MAKNFIMNFNHLQKLLLCSLICLSLAACDTISEIRKVDYKSAGAGSRTAPLVIPPELGSIEQSERYAIPGDNETTFSKYVEEKGSDTATATATTTLLPTVPDVNIGREGTYRWLIVDRPVEEIWPVITEFWMMKGFLITDQSPVTGIIETDWAEENSKTALTGFQAWVKNIFSSAYSSPERDKFWTRIERVSEGETEIYVSHQGMKKVMTMSGEMILNTWADTPRDPNAEAKMLYELMLYLGLPEETVAASGISNEAKPMATLVSIEDESGGYALMVADSVQRVWDRVGIVLLTMGASLESRDEAKGLYFVRYHDPDGQVVKKGIDRLKFWKEAKVSEPMVYRIIVNGDDEASMVTIQDENGQAVHNDTEKRILLVLQERLG